MKKIYKYLSGFFIGVVNSLIGACGGVISVILLKKMGFSEKEAHANAVAIILPLSLISAIYYIYKGYTDLVSALYFIPGGILGAMIGSKLLVKIPDKLIRKFFAFFIIAAGMRMIIK